MTDPTTPTGKRLVALNTPSETEFWTDIVLAIEREAAAAVWDGVKGEHVHLFDPEQGDWCRDCEQRVTATLAADLALAEKVRQTFTEHEEHDCGAFCVDAIMFDIEEALRDVPHQPTVPLAAERSEADGTYTVAHTPPFDTVDKGDRP